MHLCKINQIEKVKIFFLTKRLIGGKIVAYIKKLLQGISSLMGDLQKVGGGCEPTAPSCETPPSASARRCRECIA